MNKLLPYVLIVIAIVAGFFLKGYLGVSNNNKRVDSKVVNDNKIDNRFKTLLIYPKKNPLVDFTLIDHTQAQFTNNDFKNYWSLIFIGYTNCPDVCPNTLNQLVQLYNSMEPNVQQKFQFIFLTVDPERDTPEHLDKYLDHFHDSFIGLSGDKKVLDPLVRSLGGVYSLNKEEGEFYTVDHSSRIFIVGPLAERYGIIEHSALKSKDKSQLLNDLTALSN